MTARLTTEELRARLDRVGERIDAEIKGRTVNAIFARRKGLYGEAPDFRGQLVGPGILIERIDS